MNGIGIALHTDDNVSKCSTLASLGGWTTQGDIRGWHPTEINFFCGRICTENSRQMTLEGRECGSGDEMMVMVMVDVDLYSASYKSL